LERVVRALVAAALAFGAALAAPESTNAATGPYTLPFFKPEIGAGQGYGCTTSNFYPAFEGDNADGDSYDCVHFHDGIDYPMSIGTPVAASRAGTVVRVEDGHANNTSGQCPPPNNPDANFVIIQHKTNRFSVYFHLDANSIIVEEDDFVFAGEKIAESGNSGISCGGHLHYGLSSSEDLYYVPENTFKLGGKWTTDDGGRVPWLARLIDVSTGWDSNGDPNRLYVSQGFTTTIWLEFRNKGGRRWAWVSPSEEDAPDEEFWRIFLGSSDSSGDDPNDSIFEASDWIDASDPDDWRVTVSDELVVEPDETGKFAFGIYGALAPNGSATAYFNLRAESLRWFKLTKKPDPDEPEIAVDSVPIRVSGTSPP
jgi:murein DD-endopeptidase MepM/ murein hydrolase activator NlpD